MYLIILIVALSALRYFEVGIFAELSWWWITGLVVLAVIWFEVVEKWLGLDKKRAHETLEQARKERVKKNFDANRKK